LDDIEATALTENHVAGRYADVLKSNVTVTVGRVVEAKDGQHAVDSHTRNVIGDENDGLLLVLVAVVGVGLAEDDEDLAARVTNTGGPPFLCDVLVIVTNTRWMQLRLTCPFKTYESPSLLIVISMLVASLDAT
jgi:hypothetical protein